MTKRLRKERSSIQVQVSDHSELVEFNARKQENRCSRSFEPRTVGAVYSRTMGKMLMFLNRAGARIGRRCGLAMVLCEV
jgi:hypothetical protein